VLPANPSNLGSVFAAAQGGDVVELASGDYGAFSGGSKPGTVTLRPATGASVAMSVAFSSGGNIRIEGVTMRGADITGSAHDVAIANSRFTASSTVSTSSPNANIAFDRDSFDGIDTCSTCYEGRLTVRGYNNNAPAGVRITNSHFGGGGESDGVQIVGGAYGVQIGPGNEFSGIKQGSYSAHVDSIQLYGSSHTQIVGNYFHDDDTEIMAPDGGNHETITDNVFVGDGYRPAVQMGSHVSTVFAHNTVQHVEVHMDAKSGGQPSTDGVMRDNVMVDSSFVTTSGGGCSNCAVSYNLFNSSRAATGSNVVIGTPLFVGGGAPASYGGFELAAGSPGKGSASDGGDRGVRIAAPPASAPAAPVAAARPHTSPRLRVGLAVSRRITWSQLRRGFRVRVSVGERVRLLFRLARVNSRHSLVRMRRTMRRGTRSYVLRPPVGRLGHRRRQTLALTVTVTNRRGVRRRLHATVRVRP
jgi:hypothetical protein